MRRPPRPRRRDQIRARRGRSDVHRASSASVPARRPVQPQVSNSVQGGDVRQQLAAEPLGRSASGLVLTRAASRSERHLGVMSKNHLDSLQSRASSVMSISLLTLTASVTLTSAPRPARPPRSSPTPSPRSHGGTGRGLLFVAHCRARPSAPRASFATSLHDAGWSTGAAVTARITVAALVLTIPAAAPAARQWPHAAAHGPQVLRRSRDGSAYGLIAVAACQLAYFNAVSAAQRRRRPAAGVPRCRPRRAAGCGCGTGSGRGG